MMKTILHIPHASTYFPNFQGFVVDKQILKKEILELTDLFTDDLFITRNSIPVKAPFCRVFCDVERFRSDAEEVMALQGMGATYTHLENGEVMRVLSDVEREQLLQKYYDEHHRRLSVQVEKQLESYGKALIVDCHSFPNIPHPRNTDKTSFRPDICIGTDSFHTSKELLEKTHSFFKSKGLSVKVNAPYAGTMVPMEFYQKNNKVKSIMIEVNRNLYLTDSYEKSKNYNSLKEVVQLYINSIQI